MDWARRTEVPLLERLRYLGIVSSNLDEFFEVRMAPQLSAFKANEQRGLYTAQTYAEISAKVHELVAAQYAIYNDELLPLLEKKGIKLVPHGERNQRQRRWVKEYFQNEVQPLLMPVGLDPAHPFPAGGQQVAELHRSSDGQGCLWPRERNRHRQSAAHSAAVFAHATGQGLQADPLCVDFQPDPIAPAPICFPAVR